MGGFNTLKIANMRKGKSYHKKHQAIVNDYDNQKAKHLEKLASKILKDEERRDNLRSKTMKGDFLKNF